MIAGALEVQMFANIARITKDMNDVKGIVGNSMGSVEKSVQSAKNLLASLGVGLSVGVLVNKFQQIAVETDKLRGNLVTVTGGVDAAGIAFDNLTKFAAKTPFTLDQSVNAFIKLKALGLDPSERALMSYGNTAAAMGKDMMQMIEAVADASTMEFERLKEFGIKSKQEGDNVIFTFQGVSTIVEKESSAIQEYLLGIGETKFGDAMANQMERLPGKLSNLEDSVDAFFRKIGDSGGIDLFGKGIERASDSVEFLTENLDGLGEVAFAVAAVFSARMVAGLTAATAASFSTATAVGTLNAVMTALGGPVGIALLTATAIYKVAEAMIELRAESYRLAGDAYSKQALDVMTVSAEQAAINIDAAREAIARLKSEVESATEIYGENSEEVDALNKRLDLQHNWLNLNKLRQNELSSATEDSTESTNGLSAAYLSASDELKLWNASIKEYLEQQKRETEARKKQEQGILDTIAKLEQQRMALGMTERAQAIFNATMQAANDNALPEQIAKIAELTARNYDLAEANKNTAAASKAANDEIARSAAEAAKKSQENWQRTHEYMTNALVDIMDNGDNAFDSIAKSFERMVKRMIAEWAASGLMNLFGVGGGSGGFSLPSFGGSGGGGIGGSVTSSLLSTGAKTAIGSIFGAGASASALPAAGATAAEWASFYGGGSAAAGGGILSGVTGAASSAWSGITGALGSIPGWGWALAGTALAAKMLDSGGTMSGNAGFLIRDVSGASDRTFDVPAFDSGFDPVGFARREDQSAAVQVIDTFRQYDSALTAIAKASGLSVNYNSNNFGGFSEKGNGNGLFFGSANEDGRNTAVPIDQQLTQFVGQWIKGLSGQVDQSLINDVLSQGSADAMLQKAAMLAGYDGSHANGLDYVPFDGYRAVLHQGERVQTASAARSSDASVEVLSSRLDAMVMELKLIKNSVTKTSSLLTNMTPDGRRLQTVAA